MWKPHVHYPPLHSEHDWKLAIVHAGSRYRTAALEILETALLALFIFFATRLVVQNFRVQGPSMLPNLDSSELVLVGKLSYLTSQPRRGDVLVLRKPGNVREDVVKRVIGLPNETVEIRGGRVFVNGNLLDESAYLKRPDTAVMGPVMVPSDSYFVLGDNRNISEDSRYFGAVPFLAIVGKVWLVYWPPNKIGPLPEKTPTRAPAPSRVQAPIDGSASF